MITSIIDIYSQARMVSKNSSAGRPAEHDRRRLHVYTYIYIYMYIEREREIDR